MTGGYIGGPVLGGVHGGYVGESCAGESAIDGLIRNKI